MQTGMLEEYRALRAEIIAINSRMDGIDKTMAPLVAAALGATFLVKSAELPLVMSLLVCGFWGDEQYWLKHMVRIGVYISRHIEPKVAGLAWENAMSIPRPAGARRPILRYLTPLISHYPLLCILCLASSVVVKCCSAAASSPRGVALYCIAVLITLCVFCVRFSVGLRLGSLRKEISGEWEAMRPQIESLQAASVGGPGRESHSGASST